MPAEAPGRLRGVPVRRLASPRTQGRVRPYAARTGTETTRLQAALEMHELGVRMYRQRMHREHPQASRREIDYVAG
jgi:L-alanine-DL-glutamate epimerase-like enolase superfamily enzyme